MATEPLLTSVRSTFFGKLKPDLVTSVVSVYFLLDSAEGPNMFPAILSGDTFETWIVASGVTMSKPGEFVTCLFCNVTIILSIKLMSAADDSFTWREEF